MTAIDRWPSRWRQTSSDPVGTENDVTVTWPAPLRADRHAASLVGKRRPQRARRAALVAVIEVIDVMVVEVDGLLDQAEAETAEAEVEIVLRGVNRRGDVMKTENRHVYAPAGVKRRSVSFENRTHSP